MDPFWYNLSQWIKNIFYQNKKAFLLYFLQMNSFNQTYTSIITNAVVFFHRIMARPNGNYIAIAHLNDLSTSVMLEFTEEMYLAAIARFIRRTDVNL